MLAVCVKQLKHYVPLGCCIEPSPSVSPSSFISLRVHRRLPPCWPPNSRLSGEGGIDRGEQAQPLLGLLPVASGSCFQPGCGSLPLPCKEVPLTSTSCSITCLTSFLLNSLHYKDSELLLCFWPMTIGLFCATQLTFADGHPVSRYMGRAELGFPRLQKLPGLPGTVLSYLGLHPELPFSSLLPWHSVLYHQLTVIWFSFIFVMSQKQSLEGTNCIFTFFSSLKAITGTSTQYQRLTLLKKSQQFMF